MGGGVSKSIGGFLGGESGDPDWSVKAKTLNGEIGVSKDCGLVPDVNESAGEDARGAIQLAASPTMLGWPVN